MKFLKCSNYVFSTQLKKQIKKQAARIVLKKDVRLKPYYKTQDNTDFEFIEHESLTNKMWQPIGPTRDHDYISHESKNNYLERIRDYLPIYLQLGKHRLTLLVVTTAMCGYIVNPHTISPLTFGSLVLGTSLTSVAANTFNQILEQPYDSQMNRTKFRPLLTGKITPFHASIFGLTSAMVGTSILYYGVNGLTCGLGLGNIILYSCLYTPSKRYSYLCTWLGAIVGAIPPLMGWTAAASNLSLDTHAFIVPALLFCWQFPHFMALSWNHRAEYARAGYMMASVVLPSKCLNSSLFYSILTLPLCLFASFSQFTEPHFSIVSLPFNVWLIAKAYHFKQKQDSKSSRSLFKYSLVHLPALMLLFIICLKRTE